ncbi:MAG: DUF3313 domain-containing protein [Nitrospinae bacterium]|nr:DUF3313 domain-containing protein [Nitrospinota bacterium]
MKATQVLLTLLCVVLLSSCAQTRQARSVEKTGFLGDYSMLREGGKGEALLVYRNPKVNWTSYSKVMVEPVTVWLGKDSQLLDVSPEDRLRMANDLWSKLIEVLRKDYEIVHHPGPRTLRIQAAITEAEESSMVLDTVSSVVPQMRVMSEAKYLVTGTAGFVGKASAEAKITDAQTGELLLAGVDRRAGSKNVRGALNSWNDVEEVHAYWAYQVGYRLCELRGMTLDCIPPEKAMKK